MLQAIIPSAVLLVTPFDAALFSEQSCLTDNFYGLFSGQSVFNIDSSCFEAGLPGLDSGSIIPTYRPIQQLVWIQEETVDQTLWSRENSTASSALDSLLERLSLSRTADSASDSQQVFISSDIDRSYELLHRTPSSALISVNLNVARTIDTFLPPFYKSALLPNSPIPYVPVPSQAVDRVKGLLRSLKFDPYVASVVNSISLSWMKNDVRYLTGEDTTSPIVSRHSFAEGSRIAAAWLKERFEDTGATCELRPFLTGFAPNVIW